MDYGIFEFTEALPKSLTSIGMLSGHFPATYSNLAPCEKQQLRA